MLVMNFTDVKRLGSAIKRCYKASAADILPRPHRLLSKTKTSMSVDTAKDADGNNVLCMPGMNIRYVEDETHIGLSDIDCAQFLTDLPVEKAKTTLARATKEQKSRYTYKPSEILHRFYGRHTRERPLVLRDGIKNLCYHMGGSTEKANELIEVIDRVHPVAPQQTQQHLTGTKRIVLSSSGEEIVQTVYTPQELRALIGARVQGEVSVQSDTSATLTGAKVQSEDPAHSDTATTLTDAKVQGEDPVQSDTSTALTVPVSPYSHEYNTDYYQNAAAFWSKYAFEQDGIGNWIIPGSVFDSEEGARIQFTTRGLIVVDVIAIIAAIEGKNRNDSGKVWRERLEEYHSFIQEDLLECEGNLYISQYYFSDQQQIKFITNLLTIWWSASAQ